VRAGWVISRRVCGIPCVVVLDGALGDQELGGDLSVCGSLRGKPRDLLLLWSELVERIRAVRLRARLPVARSSRSARAANASAPMPLNTSRGGFLDGETVGFRAGPTLLISALGASRFCLPSVLALADQPLISL
jgi:hypothetical protein